MGKVVGLATHVGLNPTKEPHDFNRGSRSVYNYCIYIINIAKII